MNKIILVSILLMALAFPASAVNTVTIGDHIVDPNGDIRVPILLADATSVGGASIRLEYTPGVVSVYSNSAADKGDFSDFYGPDNSHNTTGYITIQALKFVEGGLSGNLTLGYVRLHAVGSPGSSSPLGLTVQLFNDAGDPLPQESTIVDGHFTVTPLPPEPKVKVQVTGVGVVGVNIMNIAKVEYKNFSSGDAYNMSVYYPNGTLAKYTSGTLSGVSTEIIPVDYVPEVIGDHNVTAYGNGIVGSTAITATDSAPVPVVPELSTIVLLSAGLVGLIGIRRYKKE